LLDVSEKHVYNLVNLPDYHKDPFDRMIISQSLIENMHLITCDTQINKYELKILW